MTRLGASGLRRLAREDASRCSATASPPKRPPAPSCARIDASIAAENAAATRLDADDAAVEAFGAWLRRIRQERDAAAAARERAEAETVVPGRSSARPVPPWRRLEADVAAAPEEARVARPLTARTSARSDEHAGRRRR